MDFLGNVETFLRIVDAGSLSKAARGLGLSLPAVSRQVQALEAELGVPLLLRSTRSMRLTEGGRRFVDHARRLVLDAAGAKASVHSSGVAGPMVIFASVTMGTLRILPSIERLARAHPGLAIELRLEDRPVDLVAEGVDLAVMCCLTAPDTTRAVAQPLAQFEKVLVASPAYLRRRGTPRDTAELAVHDGITGTVLRPPWTVVEEGGERDLPFTAKFRVSTLLGQVGAARSNLGIAHLPRFVVAQDVSAGRLQIVLPELTFRQTTAYALYRQEVRGTPRVRAVVTHFRRTLPWTAGRGPRSRAAP